MLEYLNGRMQCICDDCGKVCDTPEDSVSFFDHDLCAECESRMFMEQVELDRALNNQQTRYEQNDF